MLACKGGLPLQTKALRACLGVGRGRSDSRDRDTPDGAGCDSHNSTGLEAVQAGLVLASLTELSQPHAHASALREVVKYKG